MESLLTALPCTDNSQQITTSSVFQMVEFLQVQDIQNMSDVTRLIERQNDTWIVFRLADWNKTNNFKKDKLNFLNIKKEKIKMGYCVCWFAQGGISKHEYKKLQKEKGHEIPDKPADVLTAIKDTERYLYNGNNCFYCYCDEVVPNEFTKFAQNTPGAHKHIEQSQIPGKTFFFKSIFFACN